VLALRPLVAGARSTPRLDEISCVIEFKTGGAAAAASLSGSARTMENHT
jgi:hypothetical protein